MKDLRKYLGGLFSFLFFFFILPFNTIISAEENKIKVIDIEVELHKDGSATIHEKRKMESYEDTEVYIELSNLGESELIYFTVDGFEEEKDWDIDGSFEEKAFKYGILSSDNNYELAWGISEYGPEEYDLTYGLSNMVRELEDGQALFWNFDSFLSLPTDRMNLRIKADFALDEKLLEFYAFGFEGPMAIEEGVFEWTGYSLDESNDVTVLLQFQSASFQTHTKEDMTLEEQKEMALKGSSYNEDPPMPIALKVFFALIGFSSLGLGILGVTYLIRREKIRKENKHFDPNNFKTKTRKNLSKTVPRLEEAYEKYAWLISKASLSGGGFSEFFFLYLVLWSKEERIQIDFHEEKGFLGSKKKTTIQIVDFKEELAIDVLAFDEYLELYELNESRFEEVIWRMLLELADTTGKIEGSQIEKWAKKNAESIEKMIDLLEERSKIWLEEKDYLKTFSVEDWGSAIEIEQLSRKGEELALEIFAYRNFIEKIKEVDLEDNEDWENIMLWSILFGLAESTVKELEELDPVQWAYLEEYYPYYYGNYYGYHYLYTRTTNGLASGGYSAAGGGFSSAGGGMGAGGGGGGGTR